PSRPTRSGESSNASPRGGTGSTRATTFRLRIVPSTDRRRSCHRPCGCRVYWSDAARRCRSWSGPRTTHCAVALRWSCSRARRGVLAGGGGGRGKGRGRAGLARAPSRPGGGPGRCAGGDGSAREPYQPFRGIVGGLVDNLPPEELAAHAASCGGDLLTLTPQL